MWTSRKPCVRAQHMQTQTSKHTEKDKGEELADGVYELRMCHVYSIRGQIKKEILFSTSKASRWEIPLCLSESLHLFLFVSWINNKG